MPDEKKRKCYAPVFRGMNAFCCTLRIILMIIALPVVIVACVLVAIITFGAVDASCCIKRYLYQISHCREGNSNPELEI